MSTVPPCVWTCRPTWTSYYQEFADQVLWLSKPLYNEIVAREKVKEAAAGEDEKAEMKSDVDQSIQIAKRPYEIAKQADPVRRVPGRQTAQDNVDNYFKDNDVSRENK